ncbi:MAG TPA: ABC transporter ATP-binding protein [Candidatus Dormibacteraeota bacterium]|nr:ABC transporter ATP-binding protein [Candidatus Dormibacteraeota bacterium]
MRRPLPRPTGDRQRPRGGRKLVRRILPLFRPYRGRVTVVGVAILLTGGLGVVNPLLIREVFDRALFTPDGVHRSLLVTLTSLMIAIPLVTGAIGVVQTYMTNTVGQRVMEDLRNSLYERLQGMSLRFFTATRTGEIQSRLANDVGGVQTVVSDTASSLLSNTVVLLSTVIAMTVISWELTVLSLALVPLFTFATWRVGKARERISMEAAKSKAEMTAITNETLSVSGMLLSKVFNRATDEVDRFRRENRVQASLMVRQQMTGQAFFALIGTFFSVTPAIVYLLAGLTGSGGVGAISAGSLVAFTTLQSRLFFPVGQMLQTSVEVQSSLALFERIFEYLDMPGDVVDRTGAVVVPASEVRGDVQLDSVWFRYEEASAGEEGARPWALQEVSLDVRPGQLAAIVGPSGAGKTTISYLIPRLYDVTDGAVRVDGHDVRDLTAASLADAVGMVTQETYLFHASVRRNLLYAKPDATQEEIEAACRAALIHDRIVEMGEGYDTVVGERGYRLSGGEKQRLAIARVILKDPRVLILDEATSALDTRSERLVQAALRPLMAGRTTIAIAHRLSTILAADVIYVLDRGRLVQRGTHAELVGAEGLYRTLYEEQFGDGQIEARCHDGVVLSSGRLVETAAAR